MRANSGDEIQRLFPRRFPLAEKFPLGATFASLAYSELQVDADLTQDLEKYFKHLLQVKFQGALISDDLPYARLSESCIGQ